MLSQCYLATCLCNVPNYLLWCKSQLQASQQLVHVLIQECARRHRQGRASTQLLQALTTAETACRQGTLTSRCQLLSWLKYKPPSLSQKSSRPHPMLQQLHHLRATPGSRCRLSGPLRAFFSTSAVSHASVLPDHCITHR